jgi:hypothetical protein
MKKGAPGWWARNAFVPKRCPSVNSACGSLSSYRAIICVVPSYGMLIRYSAPKPQECRGAKTPPGSARDGQYQCRCTKISHRHGASGFTATRCSRQKCGWHPCGSCPPDHPPATRAVLRHPRRRNPLSARESAGHAPPAGIRRCDTPAE